MRASVSRFAPKSRRTAARLLAVAALSVAGTLSAHAAVFTYQRDTANTAGAPDTWALADNWTPSLPGSASDTTLEFTGTLSSSATVFTNNDIVGDFSLNQLNFTYAGPASGTAPTVTISGNTLRFVNDNSTPPALNLNATGTRTPNLVIENNISIDNSVDGSLAINANSNATLSGVISAGVLGAGVTLTGNSTVTLTNANLYTGPTVLNGGILQVSSLADTGAASGIGTGDFLPPALSLVFGGGTLQYKGTAATSTDRLFTIGNANGNDATLDNSSPAVTSVVNWTNTGALAFGTAEAHSLTFTGTPGSGNVVYNTFAPLIGDESPANPTTVNKTGNNSSFWSITNANTYSGGTNVFAGVLQSTVAGGFGTGDITVASDGTAWANGAGVYQNDFFLAGDGANIKFGGVGGNVGALVLGPGTQITGDITLQGDTTIASRNPTNSATPAVLISGKITGNFALKLGNGTGLRNLTMEFGNPDNDYTGGTTFAGENRGYGAGSSSGTVTYVLRDDEVIPNGANAGDVTMAQGDGATQTLNLNGHSETINGLNYAGFARDSKRVITNSTTTPSTLTLGDNDASGVFLGVFNDGASNGTRPLSLTKIGSGNQVLTGITGAQNNRLSGATTITGGTLTISANQFANALGDAVNYYSEKSPIVLNGGILAIEGRADGAATSQSVSLAKNTFVVTVADTTGLVVGQPVTPTDNIPENTFIVKIDGNVVTLSNKTLNSATIADTLETAATAGATSQDFHSLTLADSSTIDFGTASNIVLTFGAVTQALDGSVLTIDNWTGIPDALGGTDHLVFLGSPADFSSQFDQNEVFFVDHGFGYAALDLGNGAYEIVATAAAPVPEPASLALLALAAPALLARRRRK